MVSKKQKEKIVSGKKQWLIVSGLMVVLFVFAFGVYSADWVWNNSKTQAVDSSVVTIEGKAVCLPHKDTTGPQTMECAVGLQASSGKYYAVEDQDITDKVGKQETVKLTGIIEAPDDSQYDIVGVIRPAE